MDNITKTAALRALFIFVVLESGCAFLYFNVNNPEILLFIIGFAVLGVLSSVAVFMFVRAPKTTRSQWLPLLMLFGAIAGILGLCCSVILLVIGASEGRIDWIAVIQIPLGVSLAIHFWSKRKAALEDNVGVPR